MNWIVSFFTSFLLLLTFQSFAQIGLIEDTDGYTNVRKERKIDAEVVHQVKENEVFFMNEEEIESDSNWIEVWIPRNKFSKYLIDFSNSDVTGFIHRSRIKPIDSLQSLNSNIPELLFEIQKADTTKELTIGTFGLEIPLSMSYEVEKLSLVWNDSIFVQESILFDDLFNIAFEIGIYRSSEQRFTTYRQGETYFIKQECADGAGYYEIVWAIRNGEIVQRLVGWIY